MYTPYPPGAIQSMLEAMTRTTPQDFDNATVEQLEKVLDGALSLVAFASKPLAQNHGRMATVISEPLE